MRSLQATNQELNYIYRIIHSCVPCMHACACSVTSDFVTSWTVACQAPLSMGFSRQEYCSGWPFPPPGDLPNLGIEQHLLCLLHWRQILYHLSHWGSPVFCLHICKYDIHTVIYIYSCICILSISMYIYVLIYYLYKVIGKYNIVIIYILLLLIVLLAFHC